MYENKRGADSRELSYRRDAKGHRETRLMSEMLLKRKNASHKELVKGKMRDKGTSTWHVFEEN